MNVIGGRARGLKLKTLDGEATRPTAAKARGALLNILTPWLPGSRWLDLYAGSGAVGIEAVSRGAAEAVLVEQAPAALAVIRENVAKAKQLTGLAVRAQAVEVAVKALAASGERFDVVFLDPPYALDPVPDLEAIAASGLLAPKGRVVVEHAASRELPETVADLARLRVARYGVAAFSFFARSGEPASE